MQDTISKPAEDKSKAEVLQDAKIFSIADVAKQSRDLVDDIEEKQGVFIVKTGNQWLEEASKKPIPRPLYGPFWNEGELSILFGETGGGKTVKGVQIANEVSQQQKVVYLDLELSSKQFETRYSIDFTNHYRFNDNFFRAEMNPDEADFEAAGFETMEDYINDSLRRLFIQTGARVGIVDNITYMGSEIEKARHALPLMKKLKALKNELELSLLVLAHTPKRNQSQPLGINDLQGSSMLMNFCDSCFALGQSAKDKNLRYLKQIKTRNAAKVYDAENVAVYELSKPNNFLMFTLVHTSYEHEHLKQYSKEDKEVINNQVIELHSKNFTQREIAVKAGISLGSVNKIIKGSRSQGE